MRLLPLGVLVWLTACQNSSMQQSVKHTDSACLPSKVLLLPSLDTSNLDADNQAFWILLGDSSSQYWSLLKHAAVFAQQNNILFDSLDRHFDAQQHTVVVNQSSEDEMYRGEYFPRRQTGTFMSIEPFSSYFPTYKGTAMIEVLGIYDQVDSACIAMKQFPNARMKTCKLYMGCLH
jgi:hypothetical protein